MAQQPFIIGITGGSGSGKTVFLKAIAKPFSKEEICIISQDDYYLPIHKQYIDENGIENFDLPSSFDIEAFERDLVRLKNGQSIQIKEYVFNNRDSEPKVITLHPAPVIIVEGIFVFHFEQIRNQLDLKLFVDAREELKIIRRIKRDGVERNYPLDDVLYRYEHHVSPAYEQFIAPYRKEADIVVNNHEDYKKAADVVIGFLRSKM
jgi:uridine kinase